jgi:hypothetical protein
MPALPVVALARLVIEWRRNAGLKPGGYKWSSAEQG